MADAERSLARVYLIARAGQLAFSSLMVYGDRHRYKRPALQWALLGAITLESAWFAWRLHKAGRYDDRIVLWADTASAAFGLVACQAGLGDADGALWMKNIAIGAAMGATSSEDGRERFVAVGILAAAGVWCGRRERGRDAGVAGLTLAVNDAINWAGMHTASRVYVVAHRGYAALADEAGAATLARATQTAAIEERSRQHRVVHRGTVEVLRLLASTSDRTLAGSIARREAQRLRNRLQSDGRSSLEFVDMLREITDEVAASGQRVELVASDLGLEVPPKVLDAIRNALRHALKTVTMFDASNRVVVRATADEHAVLVTLRQQGLGSEIGVASGYESNLAALKPLLGSVGGALEIWSAVQRGVRISLSVPLVPSVERSNPPCKETILVDDAGERHRAGRTATSAFLAYRATGLATGLAAVSAAGGRYRNPRRAIAQLVVATVESAWMARRLRDRGGADRLSATVDALTAVATISDVRANVFDPDRWTFVNWAPWGVGATAMTGQAMVEDRATPASIAATVAIAATASGSLSATPGEFAANGAAMAAFFAGGRVLAHQIRQGSHRLQRAQRMAIDEGVLLAAEEERSRQLRLLHDRALQTLEAVAADRFGDLIAMQGRALDEANALQREVDGMARCSTSLIEAIREVVERQRDGGLTIALRQEPGIGVAQDAVIVALRDACNEALTNISKHSRGTHAVVRVRPSRGGVEVSISDNGVGFATDADLGFGTRESISGRMLDISGHAEIVSEPDRGTVVSLWGPA